MFEGIRALFGLHPKRSETDQQIDEALENAESLDHYFFFSDHAAAEAAAEDLQQRGWTTQSLSLDAAIQKWLLHMRQPGVPGVPLFGTRGRKPGKIENLHDLQAELDLFADEHHGAYDGWKIPDFVEPE
jgi:Regulator of ribonuclease activity B